MPDVTQVSDITSFANTWLACGVLDCAPFRLGVTVNYIFFVLGLLVANIFMVAWTPKSDFSPLFKKELKQQIHGIGYTIYLVAGCAFFGAVQWSYNAMVNHWLYLVLWSVFFLSTLLIEMIVGKLTTVPSGRMKPAQYFSLVTGLVANYWLWIGAGNKFLLGSE